MGLFSKKVCSICGGEIGLLGNRKLEDGNMCKECARKISPFFSDRRNTSVADMKLHLSEREENWRQLQFVHPTRVLGNYTKIYIDDDSGRFFVTRSNDWHKDNPDLIDLGRVIDCVPDVIEHRTEIYRQTPEGRRSFNPPRYSYSYEIDITIHVDSPWYSEIKFELTDRRPEDRLSPEYRNYEMQANEICNALSPNAFDSAVNSAVQQVVGTVLNGLNIPGMQQNPAPAAPVSPVRPFAQTAENPANTAPVGPAHVRPIVSRPAQVEPAQPAVADAPDTWTCSCGSVNTGKFCPNCGKQRPEQPRIIVCANCGWRPDGSMEAPRFCPNCGTRFPE